MLSSAWKPEWPYWVCFLGETGPRSSCSEQPPQGLRLRSTVSVAHPSGSPTGDS